ncbi:MAG: DUF6116 family protein [bacterium]
MTPRGPVGMFLAWARGLRFPWLVALAASVFFVDLLVPDFIPFVDEVLLGLATILLGTRRKAKP